MTDEELAPTHLVRFEVEVRFTPPDDARNDLDISYYAIEHFRQKASNTRVRLCHVEPIGEDEE
jgi:hypothetical protein